MDKQIKEILEKSKCFDKPEKVEIISFLLSKETGVLEISKKLQIKESTVYKYLQQMLKAGIVKRRLKKGRFVFDIEEINFSINKEKIKRLDKKQDIKLIIFDVDDTLIKRTDIPEQLASIGKESIDEAKRIFQEIGVSVSIPPEELFSKKWIHEKYGNSIQWYMATWLSVSGVPEGETKNKLVEKYVKEYYKKIEITGVSCKVFSDVKDFLEKYKDSVYFAANSNSSKKTIIETFRNQDILNYFVKDGKMLIVGGDEIPKSEKAIEFILKLSSISSKDCLLVGDTGGDIKVGRDARIPPENTIAILRGITPIENIKIIKPKVRIIKSLKELSL